MGSSEAMKGSLTVYSPLYMQIPLERHAHSANGGMRLPDYSA